MILKNKQNGKYYTDTRNPVLYHECSPTGVIAVKPDIRGRDMPISIVVSRVRAREIFTEVKNVRKGK